MPIKYFDASPSMDVRTPAELHEALDILHTQVIDNFPESGQAPFLRVLETAMDSLEMLDEPDAAPAPDAEP